MTFVRQRLRVRFVLKTVSCSIFSLLSPHAFIHFIIFHVCQTFWYFGVFCCTLSELMKLQAQKDYMFVQFYYLFNFSIVTKVYLNIAYFNSITHCTFVPLPVSVMASLCVVMRPAFLEFGCFPRLTHLLGVKLFL